MDQKNIAAPYTAVLLAAGYGSRISGHTDLPKCLLKINEQTLLERNLEIWKNFGLKKVNLVVGYKAELIMEVANRFKHELEIEYIFNHDFRNLGNTYSLYVGIKNILDPILIFDADLIYDEAILKNFLVEGVESSILIGNADIDDIECAKALIDGQGYVRKTVDKRALSDNELEQYQFAGEAIGILKFSREHTRKLAQNAETFLTHEKNKLLNWEHLLNEFLVSNSVSCCKTEETKWTEIDTYEDLLEAKNIFGGC